MDLGDAGSAAHKLSVLTVRVVLYMICPYESHIGGQGVLTASQTTPISGNVTINNTRFPKKESKQ